LQACTSWGKSKEEPAKYFEPLAIKSLKKSYIKPEKINKKFYFASQTNCLMNKLLLISFLAFYTSAGFSQDSYVTLDGQTINGSVQNNREWLKNPLNPNYAIDKMF